MNRKICCIAASLALMLSSFQPVIGATFPDMPAEDHWSYAALDYAQSEGLLSGDDGMLNPEHALTRAQMATIITRAAKAVAEADLSAFTDVSENDWFYAPLAKAVALGLFQGGGDGKMNPEANITRQEAFVVLARFLGLSGGKAEDILPFTDLLEIDDWALDATACLVGRGYVTGGDGRLNPKGEITRAEFAQMIYRMRDLIRAVSDPAEKTTEEATATTETATESATAASTEATTEAATERRTTGGGGGGNSNRTEDPTEPATEASTEAATMKPIEVPTTPPTEDATEAPTDAKDEPTADPTESTSEDSTTPENPNENGEGTADDPFGDWEL